MTPVSPLRLLLWLKGTLMLRGYRKSRLKAWSTVLMLLVFVPLSIGAAWLVHYLAAQHPALAPLVARDALGFVYGLWALTPLLGFQLNEAYDLTKLFPYPVSTRQIFAGSVLGGLLDFPVLLTLPTFVVLLTVFGSSVPGAGLTLLLLTAFLLHTLALGQAITLALIGFLRSRRFRDITIVLFPLLGMAYYVGQRVFFSQLGTASPARILDSPVWRAMGYLPPGWAARGLTAAQNGAWLNALLWLAVLLAAGLLTLWAASATLKTLYLGDAGPQNPSLPARQEPLPAIGMATLPLRERVQAQPVLNPPPPGGGSASHARRGGVLLRLLSPQAGAMAHKEWVYLRREPQFKAMAVQTVYTLVAVAVPILLPLNGRHGHESRLLMRPEWLMWGLSATLLLSLMPLLFNIWGGEGAAVTVLFSLPTPRRALLLGKNVAHGAVLLGVNFVGLTVLAALLGEWAALPRLFVWTLVAMPTLLAAGNLVSIRFPHRMLVRGQRWQKGGVAASGGADGAGCAYLFLYLLAYGAAFGALLPAIAAVFVPGHFGVALFWLALTVPLAAVYSVSLYAVLLSQAETWLLAREPEIMARILPAE